MLVQTYQRLTDSVKQGEAPQVTIPSQWGAPTPPRLTPTGKFGDSVK